VDGIGGEQNALTFTAGKRPSGRLTMADRAACRVRRHLYR
jgi:hypothetical protein